MKHPHRLDLSKQLSIAKELESDKTMEYQRIDCFMASCPHSSSSYRLQKIFGETESVKAMN
jgi:hypothetical protein